MEVLCLQQQKIASHTRRFRGLVAFSSIVEAEIDAHIYKKNNYIEIYV